MRERFLPLFEKSVANLDSPSYNQRHHVYGGGRELSYYLSLHAHDLERSVAPPPFIYTTLWGGLTPLFIKYVSPAEKKLGNPPPRVFVETLFFPPFGW